MSMAAVHGVAPSLIDFVDEVGILPIDLFLSLLFDGAEKIGAVVTKEGMEKTKCDYEE